MPVAYAEQRGNYSSYTGYGVQRMPDGQPRAVYGVRLSQPTTVPSSQSSPGLRFATWNVQSLRNKHVVVSDTITSCGIDLLVATESWHQSSSDVAVRR